MFSFIKRNLYGLIITLIVLLIAWINYVPGTWLTGWDNLHPEFNLGMNIYRSIFSVWQEYQGLGLLAGMAHAADLPRQLFLWIISFIIPQSFLRYFFHYLMLLLGSLGSYKILKDIFLSEKDATIRNRGAFLASLLYLFNFGTIQYFFTPFEPYSAFWGFFPWELYVLFRLLKNPTKRNYIYFAIVNILAIPQAYVQTIFLVYIMSVLIILLFYLVRLRTMQSFKLVFKILFFIFCLNAFWLIPNLYFTLNDVNVTQNAMNNRMNTQRFFEINKRRGNLIDFALMKGFYLDFIDYDSKTNQLTYMMNTWKNHVDSKAVTISGLALFGIVLYGLFKKNKYRPYLLGIFALCAFAFLSNVLIISNINDILRSLPLVNQIFRNPFTKFIVPTIFIFSAGFGLGITQLLDTVNKSNTKYLGLISLTLFGGLILWNSYPVFQGKLFYDAVRLKIPKEYFDLFNYFQNQDKNARIMNLPQDSYWGWGTYRWGSRGSGFLWYGIEQPIMDRAFDVWSSQLEQYYWELNYALKKRDQNLFNQILEKYQISYIVYDNSYLPSDAMPIKGLFAQEQLLSPDNNKMVIQVAKFGGITIYKTNLNKTFKNNIIVTSKLPEVKNNGAYSNEDVTFSKVGFYNQSISTHTPDYIYPFQSLFTNRFQDENPVKIIDNGNHFNIQTIIPKGTYNLNLPSQVITESIIPVNIFARKQDNVLTIRLEEILPKIMIDNQEINNSPASYEVNVDTADSSLIINVNNKDFFPMNNLNDQFIFIGSTYLVNNPIGNQIRIYSLKGAQMQTLSLHNFSDIRECVFTTGDKFINKKVTEDSLILQARNTAACATYKDSLKGASNMALNQITFTYRSKTDEFPHYCFYSSQERRCLNQKDSVKYGFANTDVQLTDFFESDGFANAEGYLNMILEPRNNQYDQNTKEITYKNIVFSSYPQIAAFSIFPEQFMNGSSSQQVINLTQDTNLSVIINKPNNSYVYTNFISNSLYKRNNLDQDKLKKGKIKFLEVDDNGKNIELYAKDTYLNFWLELPDWDNSISSIIEVQTKNKEGMPITIIVSSILEKYKYVNTLLPQSKTLTTSYFVLPPYYQFDKGLQILFHNQSFNNSPSIFYLKDVSIYPFPVNYLLSIFLKNTTTEVKNTITIQSNSEKENISSYKVNFSNSEPVTLILSQSYHDGWQAYEVDNFGLINRILPPLFGKPLTDHTLVNNWKNGWKINSTGNHNIIIIFWPQYLQFLGFGLMILALIYVGFFYEKKHERRH